MDTHAVSEHYDRLSGAYDRNRHPAFFARATSWVLAELGQAPRRVLEVGCGSGGYLQAMLEAGHDAFGVDLSKAMCQVAVRRLAARDPSFAGRVRQADFQETPGFEGPFDAVLFLDSWEFIERPDRAIQQLRRILRPSGTVLLMTPNPVARPLIELLERTRIKRLRPAFWFHQSSPRVIHRLFSPTFHITARGTLFWGLERWYRLELSEPLRV